MTEQHQVSNNKVWMLLGVGILGCLIVICIAGFLFVTFFGGQIINNSLSRGDYGQTADAFMQAMSQDNIEQAFRYVSSNGQKNISKTDLEEMTKQNLFSGYQQLEVRSLNRGNYCDIPQLDNTISIGGRIHYDTDAANDFFFIFEQEDGDWKIYCLKIGNLGIP